MFTNKQREFLGELEDRDYRQVFSEELVGTGLAFQIRRLRDSRGWTQEELASKTSKAQQTISQWEDPSYGRYTLATLKNLAGAFDVGLLVRFVSFSELSDWVVDVAPSRLCPPSYTDERRSSFPGISTAVSMYLPSDTIPLGTTTPGDDSSPEETVLNVPRAIHRFFHYQDTAAVSDQEQEGATTLAAD